MAEVKHELGLVGRKLGMTKIFLETGQAVPVTVVEVLPNRVTQLKTEATDGYSAVQVTTGEQAAHRVIKPLAGHYAKAGTGIGTGLWEFRVSADVLSGITLGQSLQMDVFKEGQLVDVTGISKGKGFAGTVKRWNFATQDMSHGNSRSHRVPGSIGQNQTPGRVFKNKKMCGHLGDERVTIQNLNIARLDQEKNVILVTGAIPGANGGMVFIKPAAKAKADVVAA